MGETNDETPAPPASAPPAPSAPSAPSAPADIPASDTSAEAAAPAPQPLPPRPEAAPAPTALRKGGGFRRIVLIVVLLAAAAPPAMTLIYRLVPPPITVLMIERLIQGQGLSKSWRGLPDIAPALPQAVIAAEDARFCEHHGFDFEAMRKAALNNQRRPGKVRGGSTISQQTAKNVFLWPGRDYLRKGLEAGFTVLEEAIWGKRRILEIYLNVVEWGPGTYGAQAAAQRYFHKDARALSPAEAARLAAILPSPLKWKAVNPGRYVQHRSARIGAAAVTVRADDLAWCVRR